jgi:hypothetical protein
MVSREQEEQNKNVCKYCCAVILIYAKSQKSSVQLFSWSKLRSARLFMESKNS